MFCFFFLLEAKIRSVFETLKTKSQLLGNGIREVWLNCKGNKLQERVMVLKLDLWQTLVLTLLIGSMQVTVIAKFPNCPH